MKNFDFYIPTRIFFGAGSINKLGAIDLPGKKALIVISRGKSTRANGYLDKVEKLLQQNNCSSVIFDEIQPNPTLQQVNDGANKAKLTQCDFVIGLGGGSPIDASKAIAIMATNSGNYWDYISGGSGKGLPIPNSPLPIVAITTTAGTGTEADPWSVVTNEELKEKIGFGYEKTFPVIAIVDPELMLSVPPKLTAYQGFDALFHAIEGYLANIATPISDAFALQSISLISKSLATCVNDGNNIDARGDVALANTISGMVESTSCCISEHSIAHALGAFYPEIPHGAALLAISKAYFIKMKSLAPQRFASLAQAFGVANATGEDFITALEQLKADCNVSEIKLSDYNAKREDIPLIAQNAIDTMGGLFKLDPVELSLNDVIEILTASFK